MFCIPHYPLKICDENRNHIGLNVFHSIYQKAQSDFYLSRWLALFAADSCYCSLLHVFAVSFVCSIVLFLIIKKIKFLASNYNKHIERY